MLLTIDVGNTNIAMGVIEDGKTLGVFRITTKIQRTADEFGITINTFFNKLGITKENIDDVLISSVVPSIMYSLCNSVRGYVHKEPIIIDCDTDSGIRVETDNPRGVGADRIVNTAGCFHEYGQSCLVIDFGTATTFDYVDDEGVFRYTVIMPGIEISKNALVGMAAKLPDVEIKQPESVLAGNTIDGMQVGVVYGYIGAVEYIIRKMKEALKDDKMKVIATGGLGKVIYQSTELIDIYDPNVSYKGMEVIYNRIKKNK